ncbi:hypothetical protein GAY28_00280 [Azospirillum brasilense]|nr:hypothetical protein [Azospirillum brasilense]
MPAADLLAWAAPVLDVIEQNLREVVAMAEVNRPAAYEAEVIKRFNNTYAAHVFGLLRTQTTLATVLALTRLWDTTRGAQSIPHVIRLLTREEVVEDIVRRRRGAQMSLVNYPPFVERAKTDPEFGERLRAGAERDANEAEQKARQEAVDLINRTDAFMSSGLRASLEALRNRSIAHSLEITRAERRAIDVGAPIDPLRIGDEEKALELTIPLVTDANILFRDLHVSLDMSAEVWGEYAKDFWGRFRSQPKGRPKPKLSRTVSRT